MDASADIDVDDLRRESAIVSELSVTRILRRAGLVKFFVTPKRLAELAAEGKDVHLICASIAKFEKNYWSNFGWILPYAEAFERFVKEFQFRAEFSERRVEHPFGYHGKLDLAGTIWADSKTRRRKAVVEVKRAAPAKPYALQTAAYSDALGRELKAFKDAERLAVYLKADGSYKAVFHQDPHDFSRFTAALTIARLRLEWGMVDKSSEDFFDRIIVSGKFEAEVSL